MKVKIQKVYKDILSVLKKPEMVILPGQLAYFFVLSIFPTITIVSYFLGILNISQDAFSGFLTSALSKEVANFLLSSSVILKTGGIKYLIVIFIAFYISSNGAASIIVTSNTIYGVKNKTFLERRIKAIVMILILLNLFLFMLLVPMFGSQLISFITYLNLNDTVFKYIVFFIKILRGPLAWFIIFIFIKIIYTMAPDVKIKSKDVNFGALFTTTCWVLITWAYSFYINHYADYSILYGSLTNVVIILLWFYFIALIFTLGMALNIKNTTSIEEKK